MEGPKNPQKTPKWTKYGQNIHLQGFFGEIFSTCSTISNRSKSGQKCQQQQKNSIFQNIVILTKKSEISIFDWKKLDFQKSQKMAKMAKMAKNSKKVKNLKKVKNRKILKNGQNGQIRQKSEKSKKISKMSKMAKMAKNSKKVKNLKNGQNR